ncbi:MAG: PLP-dependent aminotransferase family protein [Deltaproteobacteria bacterium]|nr:PLP-dependent aminotransferase family protein [Deltaproteobacteria bacterium]
MAFDGSPHRLRIDERSDEPAYQQIAAQLQAEIEAGRRAPGERLPAIRSLAAELGLHRDTVALAYEQLGQSGYVEARAGAGTFVRTLRTPVATGARRDESAAANAGGTERTEASAAGAAPGRAGDIVLALAPPVERLIALENTRPRYASGDDVVALHRLIPDPRLYPVAEFAACFEAALREEGPALFSYASPEGDPRLRRAIAERFRRYGIGAAPEEIVLCHGASQGISLALRLFTQPGDQVAVEVPTYANVLSALAGHGLSPAAVAMDAEGVDPDALDRVLARPEVKVFYTIPSFHNPLGTTTSLARRRQILEIAARHGVPVVEDGFELDLRFKGQDVAPLAALDEVGLVVHLYSFSKSLFPGVRVGSLTARGRVLEGLVALKHATDLSDALTLQAALVRFVESGAFDRHLARIRRVLAARHAALAAALSTEMPAGTTATAPEGGYQCWVELPFEVDTRDLLADAARAGVVFSPGTLFMPDARPSRGMRLSVASVDEAEIARGVAALGRVVRERAGRAPGAGRTAGMHL